MSIERLTQIIDGSQSYSEDAILTANYTDDSISRGFGYQVRRVLTVTNVGTYKLAFDLTNVPLNHGVFVMPLHMNATGGPVLVSTYGISSYSGGTAFPTNYLNYFKRIVPHGFVAYGITSSDTAGNDLREYVMGSDGTPATARGGGGSGEVPIVFPPGAIVCAEIDNNYSGDIQIAMDLIWFEVQFG